MRALLLAGAALMAVAPAAQAAFTVSVEAAGTTNTTVVFDVAGVETFDSRSLGAGQSFSTTFVAASFGQPIQITGTYSNVQVLPGDVFSNGTNYAVTFTNPGYSLTLSGINLDTGAEVPVTLFGFYLPALDRGNQVQFLRDGNVLFTFTPTMADGIVGDCPDAGNPYCGNPTGPFAGGNTGESYAFFNFREQSGLGFDEIRFFEDPQVGGYESDNHTIGIFTEGGGGGGTVIPGPAALGLFGLGLLGLGVARRRAR
jgi:hypothetical protein